MLSRRLPVAPPPSGHASHDRPAHEGRRGRAYQPPQRGRERHSLALLHCTAGTGPVFKAKLQIESLFTFVLQANFCGEDVLHATKEDFNEELVIFYLGSTRY